MTFEQIIKEIKGRQFRPVYFLCGDEPYYIDKISNALQTTVLNESEKEFNQTIIYGLETDVLKVASEAKRYPMMSEKTLVVVKEAQHLKKIEELESYISNPVTSTVLVICYKNKKLDKRKSFYKAVAKSSLYFESKRLYENQVPDWIIKHLGQVGYQISIRNAQVITDFLGADLGHISNELSKIIINLPEGSSITGEVIEEFIGINKEYNTFELNNALGHKNVVKANRIIQYFGQNDKKYAFPMIVANLYSHFSKILKFHYVVGKSKSEQAQVLGVNPFFIKDYEHSAKNYSKQKLVDIIGILRIYDLKTKGIDNASVGSGELLKEMVYKILH